MARIIIITHHYDDFLGEDYLLRHFIQRWSQAGHRVILQNGLGDWPEGDIAILHVDLSVVPTAYAEAARKYPIVVNGTALSICKKVVSRQLVQPGDGWLGPVIVKTDLNCRG
ncbi:MAG TPA: hypothetical protein VK832_18440, partial [Burkholderiaceae bacterium]|nr:hypothetical protein [Burkholderiaceae bacterium]